MSPIIVMADVCTRRGGHCQSPQMERTRTRGSLPRSSLSPLKEGSPRTRGDYSWFTRSIIGSLHVAVAGVGGSVRWTFNGSVLIRIMVLPGDGAWWPGVHLRLRCSRLRLARPPGSIAAWTPRARRSSRIARRRWPNVCRYRSRVRLPLPCPLHPRRLRPLLPRRNCH